jgi:hypothetical protein
MSVPPELVGAWRRVGLIVDGVRRADPCDVLWLQSPDWFADIRLPLAGGEGLGAGEPAGLFASAWAFAGIGTWSAPVMTWRHDFDLHVDSGLDSNPLSWEDGVVVERGTLDWPGRPVPFIEEWLRIAGDGVEPKVDVGPTAVRVEVGKWAIGVEDTRPGGTFAAVRYERTDGEWRAVGSVLGPPQSG